jgi:hypothetical protein
MRDEKLDGESFLEARVVLTEWLEEYNSVRPPPPLGGRLGEGGNGDVWRATRTGDSEQVALKVRVCGSLFTLTRYRGRYFPHLLTRRS